MGYLMFKEGNCMDADPGQRKILEADGWSTEKYVVAAESAVSDEGMTLEELEALEKLKKSEDPAANKKGK